MRLVGENILDCDWSIGDTPASNDPFPRREGGNDTIWREHYCVHKTAVIVVYTRTLKTIYTEVFIARNMGCNNNALSKLKKDSEDRDLTGNLTGHIGCCCWFF